MDELIAALIGTVVAVIAYVLMRGVRTWWGSPSREESNKAGDKAEREARQESVDR